MRACVVRSIRPQAFTTRVARDATRAILTRQLSQVAFSASYTTPLRQTRGHPNALSSAPRVRMYSTEPEEVLKVPFLADSISQGEVAKILKKAGDSVKTDETILSLDTDKTSADVNAPYPCVVVEILTKEGDTVVVGQPLAKIRRSAGGAAKSEDKPADKPADKPTDKPADKPAASQSSQKATPQAAAPQTAAPPKAEAPKAEAPKADAKSKPAAPKPSSTPSAIRTETREKMQLIRVRTSERLKISQNVNASLTTFNEIDMSAVTELRNTHGDAFLKKHGVKLGFMSVFVKAAVAALQDQPTVNASIQEKEIVYRSYNDISVAVATERGLVVPVLRDCQVKSMADIEKELGALGARARVNEVSIEEMVGGTFTISNGGVYGSLMGTPIINPPQSAILGMHGIFKRPVVVNDQIVIRPMMYVALTYDHRLIDGREAVTFLRKIKDVVEDPRRLLLDI